MTDTASGPVRDAREVVREEPLIRGEILAAVSDGPKTIPEIAAALACPGREVTFWIMAMRRYGYLREVDSTPDGYFRYGATEARR